MSHVNDPIPCQGIASGPEVLEHLRAFPFRPLCGDLEKPIVRIGAVNIDRGLDFVKLTGDSWKQAERVRLSVLELSKPLTTLSFPELLHKAESYLVGRVHSLLTLGIS